VRFLKERHVFMIGLCYAYLVFGLAVPCPKCGKGYMLPFSGIRKVLAYYVCTECGYRMEVK
jgi:uncharacterized protein (DUF983 family)